VAPPATLRIPARFNGPPGSANGGYTCGLVAAELGHEPCEVSLRAPPPLERDLALESAAEGVLVSDGATVVAQGRRSVLGLEPGEAVSTGDAAKASEHGLARWTEAHPFPSCVVCGFDRDDTDGFRIYPGPAGEGRFAAAWTPHESLAAADGTVEPECVWAALDCPSSAPLANWGEGAAIVLARLAASIDAPVMAGEPHALVSWELGREGRKREGACVLFDSCGSVLARAQALWIELRES